MYFSPDREVKRESRLTSIIDQLLSTKTRASSCKTLSDGLPEEIYNQQSSDESGKSFYFLQRYLFLQQKRKCNNYTMAKKKATLSKS